MGGSTFKLKFGHRGGNHPVREIWRPVESTSRRRTTATRWTATALPPELEVSHINLNDGTVEGMRHRELPVMSIQYHSEASPGPLDNVYLFDRFMDLVAGHSL